MKLSAIFRLSVIFLSLSIFCQETNAGMGCSKLCGGGRQKLKVTSAQKEEIEALIAHAILSNLLRQSLEEPLSHQEEGSDVVGAAGGVGGIMSAWKKTQTDSLYEDVKTIAQSNGCDARSEKMSEVFLAFGRGLSKAQIKSDFLAGFLNSGGRFQITLFDFAVKDYLSDLTFIEAGSSVIIDMRFEDHSSIQINFVNPSTERRAQIDRVWKVDDSGDQFSEFFKTFGDLYIQQRGGTFSVFDF